MVARTTIQVDGETLKLLEQLKSERRARSYGEVVKQLIIESKTLEKSEKGALPKLKRFEREKLDRLDRLLVMD